MREGHGIPLVASLNSGNCKDILQRMPLIGTIPVVRRLGRRPDKIDTGRVYDHDKYRKQGHAKGIEPEFARRKAEHGSGLGVRRWVVAETKPSIRPRQK